MNWPLNIDNFSHEDRQVVCDFILNKNNRLTQGSKVKEFEEEMAKFVGSKYSVFVSNGSAANSILASYNKDFNNNKYIVLPSTTWCTSCSPWIREGFEPIFIDISMYDFSMDKDALISILDKYAGQISCIFPTSLIGYTPDIDFYKNISDKYGVKVMFDNCENTFGEYKNKNISSYFTSTTSTYFGHQLQSVEGGFIFTNEINEYEKFLMYRNHGMARSLSAYGLSTSQVQNPDVDPLFDFNLLGNNYRSSEINAVFGLLDLKRAQEYKSKRLILFNKFKNKLHRQKFYLPKERKNCLDVNFCLPLICSTKETRDKCLEYCRRNSIEYRPIISGFLGFQTAFKKFFDNRFHLYKNSIKLHEYGFYIGLFSELDEEKIENLTKVFNNI